jgi:methylthioribose-1-phosphate isomerase
LKFDFTINSSKVNLEERGDTGLIDEGILPSEVKTSNPTFDITPLDFVTAVISENGVVTADKLVTS